MRHIYIYMEMKERGRREIRSVYVGWLPLWNPQPAANTGWRPGYGRFFGYKLILEGGREEQIPQTAASAS